MNALIPSSESSDRCSAEDSLPRRSSETEPDGSVPIGGNLDGGVRCASGQEHYIPVRKSQLIAALSELPQLPEEHREAFRSLCQLLEATFHHRFHREFEYLKDDYAPFDPDQLVEGASNDGELGEPQQIETLFGRFGQLLTKANYSRLDREEIKLAIGAASEWGVRLKVDLDFFRQLEVYARGDVLGQRERRRWRNFYRPEVVDVPIYERLAVMFRIREVPGYTGAVSPQAVYIKLFKNIPKQDVDMLLPGSKVQMSLLDQGKILLPTVSGAALSLFKVVKLLAFASLYGMFTFLAAVGGTLGYGAKSFFGYLRTKDKYQHHLTRSLYYQNLDNNAGVLFRLLDEAEAQEFRESILAWFVLWCEALPEGWTEQALDRRVERLLWELFRIQVDFEIDDALDKLQTLGLAHCDEQSHWHAVEIEQALEKLDAAWDGYFDYHRSGS